MKLLAIALSFAILSQHVISQESLDINDQITDISNCLRNILQNETTDLGLPILDPLNVPELNVDLSSFGIPLISGTLELTNLSVEGIADFDLEDVDISINGSALTLKFKLIEPRIILNSDYKFNARIYGFPIIGNGQLSIVIDDLVALVDITAELQIGNIQVVYLQINPTIGNLKLEIGGSLGAWVGELLQTYINNHSNELGVLIGEYLMNLINDAKGTSYDINNIIKIIFTKCIQL